MEEDKTAAALGGTGVDEAILMLLSDHCAVCPHMNYDHSDELGCHMCLDLNPHTYVPFRLKRKRGRPTSPPATGPEVARLRKEVTQLRRQYLTLLEDFTTFRRSIEARMTVVETGELDLDLEGQLQE